MRIVRNCDFSLSSTAHGHNIFSYFSCNPWKAGITENLESDKLVTVLSIPFSLRLVLPDKFIKALGS